MLCKIIRSDVDAEPLDWQKGTSSVPLPSRSSPRPGFSSGPNGVSTDEAQAVAQKLQQIEARRLADMEQARQAGFEQGLRQARQESAAEMERALDNLAQTVRELTQIKKKLRNEAEHELVKLSLAIAQRILHREITTDPQSLLGVVYAALQRLQNKEIFRIRVFPASVTAVRSALEKNAALSAVEIVPDAMLPAGAVIFETSFGELDASIDTQLQEIERGFTDRLQLR
jgi:flagellar assembly protein FliH